jgi:hypothetical protein
MRDDVGLDDVWYNFLLFRIMGKDNFFILTYVAHQSSFTLTLPQAIQKYEVTAV